MDTLGNKLYNSISTSRGSLFLQGEMAQLTYIAFEKNIEWIKSTQEGTTFPISYPIGYRADNTTILSKPVEYSKEELSERFLNLALNKLPIDSIYQLVTIMETLFNNILRLILLEYPHKIPLKKQVDVKSILSCSSIDDIKKFVVDIFLNEIAYKSPKDYATEFNNISGVNLLEAPAFHKYMELKATRDIYIHNSGVANDIYTTKADMLARVKSGLFLPVDIQYFLMSYEQCLQLTEVLEKELDKIWPSENFRNRKIQTQEKEKEQVVEKFIEDVKSENE